MKREVLRGTRLREHQLGRHDAAQDFVVAAVFDSGCDAGCGGDDFVFRGAGFQIAADVGFGDAVVGPEEVHRTRFGEQQHADCVHGGRVEFGKPHAVGLIKDEAEFGVQISRDGIVVPDFERDEDTR